MGSAGSGKSYHITEKLVIRALKEKIRIMVCRRYKTTIRQTVFDLFKEVLTKWKLTSLVKINESDYRIAFPNGSQIIFSGLDEETKLLSLNNISTIWVEEAFECNADIVEQLNLRMRGGVPNQQIILSWNPISKNHWLYDFVEVNPPESFILHRSTYKDNKFLAQEYINSLEELRVRNPQKARIFCDGEWGINTDGLVLKNWEIQDFDEMELARSMEHRAGSDLGFIDPTTIIDSLYDANTGTIYVFNEFYSPGCQLDEVYKALEDMGLTKSPVWFDSAEPRTIDYFKKRGINAKAAIKGANSVMARIKFLQNNKIIVKPKCQNMIMELSNFSYEKDKQTGQFIDDKFTHEFSHAIDGLGYAYSDIYTRGGLRTIDKRILGL
jgi:phage terminase large subunit